MTHERRSPWALGDPEVQTVVLVAHDNMKQSLLDWAALHKDRLASHQLVATGNTGSRLRAALDLDVFCVKSGPLGGDQQIGAMIADGLVDVLIFFWDPLSSQPHDPDVKALLRLAVLHDVRTACNVATADAVISTLPAPKD